MISKEDYEFCRKRFKEMWEWISEHSDGDKNSWFNHLEFETDDFKAIDEHTDIFANQCYACEIVKCQNHFNRCYGCPLIHFRYIAEKEGCDTPCVKYGPYNSFINGSDEIECARAISDLEWMSYEEFLKGEREE